MLLIVIVAYQWLNGGFSILAECQGAIVHNALVVVLHTKVGDVRAGVLVEVVRMAIQDVLPVDLNILVALGGALLMVEAQRVQQLMDNNTVRDTFGRIEIEYLAALTSADARPAAGIVTLDQQPVLVALLIWPEAYAAAFVIFLECLQYNHRLVGRCASSLSIINYRIYVHYIWLLTEVLRIYVERHGGIRPSLTFIQQPIAQQFTMQHDVTLKEAAVLPNVARAVLCPKVECGTCKQNIQLVVFQVSP